MTLLKKMKYGNMYVTFDIHHEELIVFCPNCSKSIVMRVSQITDKGGIIYKECEACDADISIHVR